MFWFFAHRVRRYRSVIFLTLLLVVPTVSAAAVLPSSHPNVLIFVADDMGWGDSVVNNPAAQIKMPNLEQLAAEGMRFTDAHTSAAKCAPTRYSIVTGNYQWRGRYSWGQWNYLGGSQIRSGQWTLGDLLKRRGYNTAFFGKSHLGGDFYMKASNSFTTLESKIDFGRKFANGPLDHGFNYSFLLLRGIQDSPYAFFENDRLVGDPRRLLTWIAGKYGSSRILATGIGMPYWDSSQAGPELARRAISFIDRHHQENLDRGTDRPFFVYYASQAAHTPHTPPPSLLGKPVRGVTRMTSHTDMIYETDVALGALLAAVRQRGLMKNTLVVFTSDNGGTPNELQLGHDSVGGLRGKKGQIWEGGHRVPLVASWGDGTSSGSVIGRNTRSNQLIGTHDLMATLAAVVGEDLPADQARDSFDFLPVLLGTRGDSSPVRDHIIMEADLFENGTKGRHFAYREGPWKLIFDQQLHAVGLYNLAIDLAETTNLQNDPAQAGRKQRLISNFQRLRAASRTAPN